jgi:hypothetical protein
MIYLYIISILSGFFIELSTLFTREPSIKLKIADNKVKIDPKLTIINLLYTTLCFFIFSRQPYVDWVGIAALSLLSIPSTFISYNKKISDKQRKVFSKIDSFISIMLLIELTIYFYKHNYSI